MLLATRLNEQAILSLAAWSYFFPSHGVVWISQYLHKRDIRADILNVPQASVSQVSLCSLISRLLKQKTHAIAQIRWAFFS